MTAPVMLAMMRAVAVPQELLLLLLEVEEWTVEVDQVRLVVMNR